MYPYPSLMILHHETDTDHFLSAWLDMTPKKQVGRIAWSKVHGGVIWEADVVETFRRNGVATMLWELATQGDWTPAIRMAGKRTNLGDLWEKSLGTNVPHEDWDGNWDTYWGDH